MKMIIFLAIIVITGCNVDRPKGKDISISQNTKGGSIETNEIIDYVMGLRLPTPLNQVKRRNNHVRWDRVNHWMTPLFKENLDFDHILYGNLVKNDNEMYKVYLAVANEDVQSIRVVKYSKIEGLWNVDVLRGLNNSKKASLVREGSGRDLLHDDNVR